MVIKRNVVLNMKNKNIDKRNIINFYNQKKFNKISKISNKVLINFANDDEIVKIIIIAEINLKNYFKAEQYLKEVLLKKKTAEIYYLLGNTFKIQNKHQEAIEAFQKCLEKNPVYSEAYNNLANVQKKIGDNEQALSNYLKAIKNKKDNFEAYYNLANLQKSLKQFSDALKNYKKVVDLKPDFAEAYNNIGAIYSILGKFDEGKKFFIKAIEKNKYFPEPYKNYVQSNLVKKNDKIFNKILSIITEDNLNDLQKEVFFYSASKGFFDLNQKDLAFKYLNLANQIKFINSNYSFKKEKKEFREIKEYFKNKELIDIKFSTINNIKPIFILGMPRSGTSLIEQILSNHSEIHGAGELDLLPLSIEKSNWKNIDDFLMIIKKIRISYMEELKKISNKKYITDKLPGNFKRIGFILNAFPEAKIIHLKRNPMAICWSNYKSSFNSKGMSFTLDQKLTAQYYVLYEDLMNFWKLKYPNKILDLDYDILVEKFKDEVKMLFKKLDLKWEKQLYDFYKNERPVETASFKQVRSKIYTQSSEKWKMYQDFLKPMTDALDANKIKY